MLEQPFWEPAQQPEALNEGFIWWEPQQVYDD